MRTIDLTKMGDECFDELEKSNVFRIQPIPSDFYINLLKRVDKSLEKHGLEVVILEEENVDPETPMFAFRIEERR